MIGEQVPFSNALVPREKLTHYLLDLHHPDGGSKARYFLGHGYRAGDPEVLAAALLDHVFGNPIVGIRHGRWGAQIAVAGPMTMPDGTVCPVLSVWLHQDSGDGIFVTAYPHR